MCTDIEKAKRNLDRANRKYLNGSVSKRKELRKAYVEAGRRYQVAKNGRAETLKERFDRLKGI